MTEWQWSVILALIRYVLANAHYEINLKYSERQRKKDSDLLAEALKRDHWQQEKQ